MTDLKISIIQTFLIWEDIEANLSKFGKLIRSLAGKTDLVILPEMFNSGFSMNREKLAEEMNGVTIQWMRQMAREANLNIIGSLIVKDGENYFNRLMWVGPGDIVGDYDKRHLFRMAEEHHYFKAGSQKFIGNLNGWNICPLICYDLRFPVWCRTQNESDLMVFIANWPEARSHAWKTLLQARAIENQCYVAGVNIVGTDGNGKNYAGDSVIVDPMGKIISSGFSGEEKMETLTLSYDELSNFRKSFPFGLDADNFEIII